MNSYLHVSDKMDDCLYSNISAVVSNWCSIDFEMIGADAWGFEFAELNPIKSSNNIEYIWDRVHAYHKDSWKSLEIYYGVKVTWNYTKTYRETLSLIYKELAEKRPILVYINSHFCPWHPRQDEYNMHFCLVVGIDKDNEGLLCVDPSLNVQKGFLPLTLFSEGWGPCITFLKSSEQCRNISWQEIVSNALDRLWSGDGINESSFNSMRRLSNELDDEINNSPDKIPLWVENPIPVVISVNLLQKGRIYFSIALKHLAERYDNHDLLPIANRLSQAAKKWNSISFMVYKAKSNHGDYNTLIKIPQKICEIAKFEEEIAFDLMRSL